MNRTSDNCHNVVVTITISSNIVKSVLQWATGLRARNFPPDPLLTRRTQLTAFVGRRTGIGHLGLR